MTIKIISQADDNKPTDDVRSVFGVHWMNSMAGTCPSGVVRVGEVGEEELVEYEYEFSLGISGEPKGNFSFQLHFLLRM